MSYRGYSDIQVESMSNGCGSQNKFLKWLRPPHGKFFKPDCDKHDVDYSIGGTEKHRLLADQSLKIRMVGRIMTTDKEKLIEEMYTAECGIPNWIISFLPKAAIIKVFKLWAVAYCKALALGGKSSFNFC